jgi:hypothetical protein
MSKTLDKQTMKLAAVLMESLPAVSGQTMQYWIDSKNRRELKEKLWKALRRFDLVWQTVFLKSANTVTEIRKAFSESGKEGFGVHMSDDMERLLPRIDLTIENSEGVTKKDIHQQEVKLVGLIRVSVAQLGLEEGGSIREVFAQAKAFGLGFCSWQIALNLRLLYKNQPADERLYIGMESTLDEDENEVFPFLDNTNEGMFIAIAHVDPRTVYSADTEWVFVVTPPASAKK